MKKQFTAKMHFEPIKNAPVDTVLPVRKTKYSAGYDFYLPETITIPAHGCTHNIPLNIKAIMPSNFYLQLYIRSSMAVNMSLVLETSGVIDADYANNPDNDGNICIKLRNNSDENVTLEKGTRICQGIFQRYFVVENDITNSIRCGGYGSTGVK